MVVAARTSVGGSPQEGSMKSKAKRAPATNRAKIRDLAVTNAGHVKGGSLDRRTTVFLVPPKELVAK
jgi:hypothetical protein